MSLIDIVLPRRKKAGSQWCRPTVELLEDRQCPSVAAPTGLQLTAISPTQVKLTWNNVAGDFGYRVYRWDGSNTLLAATVGKDITTATVGQLLPNQTQWFTVQAYDLSTAAQTAWASVQTPADAITVPTNVRLTNITQTTMTLQWGKATGATGYNIFGWNGTQAFQIGSTNATTLAFNLSGLSQGVIYYFYVQAFNNTNTASSDWISATTLSTGIAAPTNLKTQVLGTSTIALSWKDVANETGYRVFGWNGNSATSPVVLATLAANTTGYQAVGLLPGQTYWFYIQAYNATNFANTAWVTATTVAALPLQPPTQLTAASSGPNSVQLTWVEPARAVGYRVYVWNGFSWSLATSIAAGTHKTTISGLTSSMTHWFFVEAFTTNSAEVADSSVVFVNL
jgi:hypothetical protein